MTITIELVGIATGLIWLMVLSFFFWKIFSHYNSLTRGVSNRTLTAILNEILAESHTNNRHIATLQEQYATIEKREQFHIQKIGLLRFNPFKDTGGDQSFTLALIDAHDTGVVISGLYSRSGTRWYAKRIVNGKGVEHDLSDEEKKAIKEAKTTA